MSLVDMTEQEKQEMLDGFDWMQECKERCERRLLLLTKKNPEKLFRHVQKIVARTTLEEYKAYADEIIATGEKLEEKDGETFREHGKALTMDANGVSLYIGLKVKPYRIIARRAGLQWGRMKNFIETRAAGMFLKDIRTVKTDTHKVANDKVAVKFFNPTTKQWEEGLMQIWENPNDKRKKAQKVLTPVEFKSNEAGKPLPRYNSFDKAVFTACYSIQAAGNLATTTDIIFANMTGKGDRGRPTQEMRRKIKDSIIKMSGCWVRIDIEAVNAEFGYNAPRTIYEGQLLYAKFEETRINGKTVKDAVFFLDKSPLIQVAEIKKQILSYPRELLDVPVSASEDSIVVREELLRRIHLILNHEQTPSILFESVLEPIGYATMSKSEKLRERRKIFKMMDKWKADGLFKDYSVEKAGNTPVKMVITPSRKRADE